MPSLRELQASVRDALLGGDDRPAAVEVAEDGLAGVARLRLYRHHVFTTLTEALAATYPVVCRLVDPRFFAYAADRYVRRHPPAGPCLFEYGAAFADFLAAFPPARGLACLPDVARLEWAMNAALFAEDARPLDPTTLGALAPAAAQRVVLRLDPSVRYVESPWPVDLIWRANQPEADPGCRVDLRARGARLEVRRAGDRVGFRGLEASSFAFRRALAAGSTLGQAAEAGFAQPGGFELAHAVHALLSERLVTDLSLASEEDHP